MGKQLSLVPPSALTAKEALIERIKALPKRDDAIGQCTRCGGRQTMILRSGDMLKNGRIIPGTVIESGICPHCWKQGIISSVFPPKPRVVKPPKPRRTKPKLVK